MTHAEARRIAERHYHDPREGSLPWLFITTGAIPMAWPALVHDLAIQDKDDELALIGYLEATGPRESWPGWDRVTVG